MAREEIRVELRSALHNVFKLGRPETRPNVRFKIMQGCLAVNLAVKPFPPDEGVKGLAMVVFEPAPLHPPASEPGPSPAVDERILELESELNGIKESLQTTIEELETSNEELKSTNEELQSTNEELQSTNEELETSKEELQSINEELITVNAELQLKLDELVHINNDMTNLISGADISTIFLDKTLRITRFTPNVSRIINLIPGDIGRPIEDIAPKFVHGELAKDAEEVARTLAFKERELETHDGGWSLMRITPYRTMDNVIDGVVITFTNFSELKRQRIATETALELASKLADEVPQPMLVLDGFGRALFCNSAMGTALQIGDKDIRGHLVYNLPHGTWNVPTLEAFIDGRGDAVKHTFEVKFADANGKRRQCQALARRIKFGTGKLAQEQELISVVLSENLSTG